jgi:hypothetical protein
MCMSVSSPPPRDIATEGRETLQAQIDLAPQKFAADAQFGPQYDALARQRLLNGIFGDGGSDPGLLAAYERTVPRLDAVESATTSRRRQQDIADVGQFGQAAVQAVRNADPQQAALLAALNNQATQGVNAGSGLTPEERRMAQQSARMGQADRGLGFGPGDAFVETLATDRYGAGRRQQRQGFGVQVAGLNAATAPDAMQLVTGRSSGIGQAGGLFGQAGGINARSGAPGLDPFSAYGSDVHNTNFNADAAARIAEGNANAALWSSAISSAGSAAGSV